MSHGLLIRIFYYSLLIDKISSNLLYNNLSNKTFVLTNTTTNNYIGQGLITFFDKNCVTIHNKCGKLLYRGFWNVTKSYYFFGHDIIELEFVFAPNNNILWIEFHVKDRKLLFLKEIHGRLHLLRYPFEIPNKSNFLSFATLVIAKPFIC